MAWGFSVSPASKLESELKSGTSSGHSTGRSSSAPGGGGGGGIDGIGGDDSRSGELSQLNGLESCRDNFYL